MDSGNSGSIQSSSGGEEEYDSRAAGSISPFFYPPQQQPPPPHQHHNSAVFDPLSNYFSPPLLNLDTVWTTKSPNNNHPILTAPSSTVPFPPVVPDNNTTNTTTSTTTTPRASSSSTDHHQHHNPAMMPRSNPKKRSRASRRAPTTVLTTDTTNFRAMVQEFTGIPAPPFGSSSPFSHRNRLDLFRTPTGIRSNPLDTTHDSQPPSYLLRPFPQKFQPFLSSNISTTSTGTGTTSNNNNMNNICGTTTTTTASTNSINYHQLSCDQLGLLANIQQNPILTFQSLLQSPPPPAAAPKYPLSNSALGHVTRTQLAGLPNLVSSDGTAVAIDDRVDQSHLRGLNVVGNERGHGMVEPWMCSSDLGIFSDHQTKRNESNGGGFDHDT